MHYQNNYSRRWFAVIISFHTRILIDLDIPSLIYIANLNNFQGP